jgi:hypothetical protein
MIKPSRSRSMKPRTHWTKRFENAKIVSFFKLLRTDTQSNQTGVWVLL